MHNYRTHLRVLVLQHRSLQLHPSCHVIIKNWVGHEMAKILLLVLFALSYRIVRGQLCQQLPENSVILANFESRLSQSSVQSPDSREIHYNCIAYDGTSRNLREMTVTVRYITGSSVFSARATYMCGETNGWSIPPQPGVMADTGTQLTAETNCSNCKAPTETTCTRKLPLKYRV